MLAHDILLPVNAWGIEAFRDARRDAVPAAAGVDGFRVGVLWHLIKDDLSGAPSNSTSAGADADLRRE
jgi:hypothetical protein